ARAALAHAGRETPRMSEVRAITLTVNGQLRRATAEPRTTLVDLLRTELRLTGTHVGCEHGVCGACTVLVDGEPVRGCLMLAAQADGARVETVEGLAPGPHQLTRLQAELVRNHGVQCGFCIGGILMSLTAALREDPHPTEAAIRHALAAHLCRCTGYQGMVDAVLAVAALNAPDHPLHWRPTAAASPEPAAAAPAAGRPPAADPAAASGPSASSAPVSTAGGPPAPVPAATRTPEGGYIGAPIPRR